MKQSLRSNVSTNFIFIHSTSSRSAFPGLLILGCSENVTGIGKLNYSRAKHSWSSYIIPDHFIHMCQGVSQWTQMLHKTLDIVIQAESTKHKPVVVCFSICLELISVSRHEIELVRECLSKQTNFLSKVFLNSWKCASVTYETIFDN